jgi:hypothetical protein
MKGYINFVLSLVVWGFLWYAAHPKLAIGVYPERM